MMLGRHIGPCGALRAVLDGHSQSGIEELMPWRFTQPSSPAK